MHLVEARVDLSRVAGRPVGGPARSLNVHPNGMLVSMPITTAIIPALMTCRASNGDFTIR